MSEESVVVVLRAAIGEFTGKMHEAAGEADKLGSKSKQFSSVAGAGLLALGGVATTVGVTSIHMADTFEISHARLEQAVKNTGQNFEELNPKIESADHASEKFGYTSAETEAALAQLTTGTGNTSEALKLLPLAQDVAAASGKDLASSALAVTKASEGQLRPLKMLGIDLPIAAGGALKVKTASDGLAKAHEHLKLVESEIHSGMLKGKSAMTAYYAAQDKVSTAQTKLNDVSHAGGNIIDALQHKLGGQAAAASDTFAGKQKKLKAEIEDVQVKIGLALIPIIEKLASFLTDKVIPAVQAVVDWFSKHKTAAIALGVIVGGVLVAALAAFTIGLFTAGGALAFLISPVTLVVAAITGLAIGLIYAWNHFKTFRTVVLDVVHAVQAGISRFVEIVQGLWQRFGATIIGYVAATWHNVQRVISGALQVIQGVFQLFSDFFHGHWSKLWGDVLQIVNGAWKIITGLLSQAWNNIKVVAGIVWNAIGDTIKHAFNNVLSWLRAAPGKIVGFFAGLPARMGSALTGLWDGLKDGFKAAINWIIGIWNGLQFSLPSVKVFGHKIGGQTIGTPDIPLLRELGGPVTKGHLYIVGEKGTELYKGPGGEYSLLGAHGTEFFVAPNDGRIIPHNQLNKLPPVYRAALKKGTSLHDAAGQFGNVYAAVEYQQGLRHDASATKPTGSHPTSSTSTSSFGAGGAASASAATQPVRLDDIESHARSVLAHVLRQELSIDRAALLPVLRHHASTITVHMPVEIRTAATADDVVRVIKSRPGQAAVHEVAVAIERATNRPVGAPPR